MEPNRYIAGQWRPTMDAREEEIQAFVRECTHLRRMIQDDHALSEEQYRYLKSHLETLLTDLKSNLKRRAAQRPA